MLLCPCLSFPSGGVGDDDSIAKNRPRVVDYVIAATAAIAFSKFYSVVRACVRLCVSYFM